jgi:serine phosphatase RsbU (regulator of sigma subunit)
LAVSQAIAREVFANALSSTVAERFAPVSEVVRILIFAILLWIVIQGIRRQGLEGWLVLPAILLRGISVFTNELTLAGVRLHLIYFAVPLSMSSIVVTFVVAMLLIRRLQRSIKAQRELALDLKQAKEVQQVILPKANVAHPGLAIESVYRPAREVGGDFFQIIPHPSDCSVLIVAGDVAGKGLRAGMIVSFLIGAVRMAVEVSADPLLLLKALNRRLMGQESAYATCVALQIAPDGLVTLANAGHLPPYINDQPVAMEPAFPLGMFEDAEPSVMKFILEEQEKLVLISDGIPEATDSKGEFFGSARIRHLLYSNVSASALADAAQLFGQKDDICVISVTRCEKAPLP